MLIFFQSNNIEITDFFTFLEANGELKIGLLAQWFCEAFFSDFLQTGSEQAAWVFVENAISVIARGSMFPYSQ